MVTCRHVQGSEKFVLLVYTASQLGLTSVTLPSCWSSRTVSFGGFIYVFLLQWIFFFFYHFLFASLHILLMILLFKMASRSNAEVLPSVPKHRKPWCALWRKYGCRYTSFTQVMVLLAMKSMLVNQQYVLNKMSSHRNIHKTRLCADQRHVGNDPCISPRRNSSVFPNSIFSASL